MPDRSKEIFLCWIFLAVLSTLPFIRLLQGEYLFDDIQVVEHNATLKRVASISDCFRFVLKPSKPVTNFFLAFGQWLGGGAIFWPRFLSLAAHLAVTLLLFTGLRALDRPFGVPPTAFAFWVSAVFCVHPLHTESLAILLFRMEILGALFTLLGVLAAQRSRHWLVFVFAGLATLSKETFALIYPVTVAILGGGHRKYLIFGQVFWVGILGWLLLRDSGSQYPFNEVIGWGVIPPSHHLELAARALIEGAVKFLSGHGLTTVRLRDRQGMGLGLGLAGQAAVVVSWLVAGGLLMRLGRFWRVWARIPMSVIGLYLVIPNINIGSEHYWYLPTAALSALLVGAIWDISRRVTTRPVAMVSLAVLGYAAALGTCTWKRTADLRTRLEFYTAELERHPETPSAWSSVALALMERSRSHLPKAKPFIDEALRLDPNHPQVMTVEFLYYFHSRDRRNAALSLARLEAIPSARRSHIGQLHFHQGLLEEEAGDRRAAESHFHRALGIEPGNSDYWKASQRVAAGTHGAG